MTTIIAKIHDAWLQWNEGKYAFLVPYTFDSFKNCKTKAAIYNYQLIMITILSRIYNQ